MRISLNIQFKAVVRWALGLLFVWAALSKLANPTEFLGSIYAYELPLPDVLLRLAAMAVPWLELLCGLALLANLWTESALATVLGLFAMFIIFTGQAWARGLDISCGCFNLAILGIEGGSDTVKFIESARVAFFRNIIITGFAAYLFLRAVRSWKQPQESE